VNRNPRYDILFEPVKIGPVTAPNRFYCTPHALGTGNQMPHTRAAMREVRAEGGWGVVDTGYCSIRPSSDDAPLPYCRLWNDDDIAVHELMVNAVSAWTFMNQSNIRRRMSDLGIAIKLEHRLTSFSNGTAELASVYRDTDRKNLSAASLVIVGVRKSCDDLSLNLQSNSDRLSDASIQSLRSIGDCHVPGTIAHAVYSGHEWARIIDAGENEDPSAALEWKRPHLIDR
jgi:hypothetical protein